MKKRNTGLLLESRYECTNRGTEGRTDDLNSYSHDVAHEVALLDVNGGIGLTRKERWRHL